MKRLDFCFLGLVFLGALNMVDVKAAVTLEFTFLMMVGLWFLAGAFPGLRVRNEQVAK